MCRYILILLILMLILPSCAKKYETKYANNDSITTVSSDDIFMNNIIQNARETINVFIKHLQNPEADETTFLIKFPFETDPGSKEDREHIWIEEIHIKNDKYFGKISNDPFYIKNLMYGDEVQFDINKISDWMYMKNDKIIGGKSIKFLIENTPENERTDEQKSMLEMFQ